MTKRNVLSASVGTILYIVGVAVIPHRWCGREAGRWFAGDAVLQESLARDVQWWIHQDLGREDFHTAHSQFNGEWLFGTYLMAGLGFGQLALEHPEWHKQSVEVIGRCIDRILSERVRAFDRESWGNDPLETLDGESDHAAYLGYFNLLLSMHRLLDPTSSYADLNDRITATLARRLERSPHLLLETYPNEVYPVDNCAVIGSIGLYDRATGADHSALLQRWTQRCRQRYVDPVTGLLYQAVNVHTGDSVDDPRGSGTTLGLYFLSFANPALARELFEAARHELAGQILGFGVVREYPRHVSGGEGDIDSGPLIFGYSISATGFSLGGSRMFGDRTLFARLYKTAYLFGSPVERGGRREFVMGGPLGNAILFAMLTAQPIEASAR